MQHTTNSNNEYGFAFAHALRNLVNGASEFSAYAHQAYPIARIATAKGWRGIGKSEIAATI